MQRWPRKRLATLALLMLLAACLCWAAYDAANRFCGWSLEVGDAVIVSEPTGRFPATVIGFGERGVQVRSEDPATAGMVLWYEFDQCRVVERTDPIWIELGGQPAEP